MDGGKPAKWWISLAPHAHTRFGQRLTPENAPNLYTMGEVPPYFETFTARAYRVYGSVAEARIYAPSSHWLWERIKEGTRGWTCRTAEAMVAGRGGRHLALRHLDEIEAALVRIRAELIALGEPGSKRRPRRGTMHHAAREAAKKV